MKEIAKFDLVRKVLPSIIALMFLSSTAIGGVTVLHDFQLGNLGIEPTGNLISDSHGNLYGTTGAGGTYDWGTIFELTLGANGKWREKVLYSFTDGSDGSIPESGLIFDASGNLYGTTQYGGAGQCSGNSCGTVFELSPSSGGNWTLTTLYHFEGSPDGANPVGNLVIDAQGDLYGVTGSGGTIQENNGLGVVYELSPGQDGQWSESVLYSFQGGADGALPAAGLVVDQQGNLYGSTSGFGQGAATVFQLSPSSNGTWTHKVLFDFNQNYYSTLAGMLTLDSSGNLFGTAQGGPGVGCDYSGCGFVYELMPAVNGPWAFSFLYVFEGGQDGASPIAGMVRDQAGNFYGTTEYGGTPNSHCAYGGCGTVFELSPGKNHKWTEKVIHRFGTHSEGNQPGGANPVAGLLIDATGKLYGTTQVGGSAENFGTAFELSPVGRHSWKHQVIHNFSIGLDGTAPMAALVGDSSRNYYGTTSAGGTGGCSYQGTGCGTVFRLIATSKGFKESIIYNFTGGADGANPQSALVRDATGALYGTAPNGGARCNENVGGVCGTVFRLALDERGNWQESTIYRFGKEIADGAHPMGGLALDSAGNILGTTSQGGACSGDARGCGTVFELTPSGDNWVERILYRFAGGSDGEYPTSSVVLDTAGNIYGTTESTVFRLTPGAGGTWDETVLYTFANLEPTGLTLDSSGNVYGVTSRGGQNYSGMVFELSPTANGPWIETTLYNFSGRDGSSPNGIVFDASGMLYGTTSYGGTLGNGVIFTLSPGSGNTWTESVVYAFQGSDGISPNLVTIEPNGDLIGTALSGGPTYQQRGAAGTVFEYSSSKRSANPQSREREVLAK
jgi:uncharacterized repeat protein (TIGR03803 family)